MMEPTIGSNDTRQLTDYSSGPDNSARLEQINDGCTASCDDHREEYREYGVRGSVLAFHDNRLGCFTQVREY
jgi:hypothetical protein